jgi:hypothetical protein
VADVPFGDLNEAFAVGRQDGRKGTLAVNHLAIVPAEIPLPEIAVQILFADVVIDAHHAALDEGVGRFRRVVVNVATDVFSGGVTNGFMASGEFLANVCVGGSVPHRWLIWNFCSKNGR